MRRNSTARLSIQPSPAPAARASLGFFPLAWAVYLAATPLYVFPSGYPQPGDGLMAVLILVLLTGFSLRAPKHTSLYLLGALFIGHVAIVNWVWWLQYKDQKFLLASIYYAYNCGIFLFVISLFQRYGANVVGVARASLTVAALIVLAFCLVTSHVATGEGERAIGTFNNPNQLGYWSLLAVGCFLVLKGNERLNLLDFVFLATATYLAALSLSKAALLSLFALLLTALVGQGVERRSTLAILVVLLGLTPLLVLQSGIVGSALLQTQAGDVVGRLQNIGQQHDDSLVYRGYDRIWLYPQYLIFGAGEGAFERFDLSKAPPLEMHSTFGTLLFSYGMVGFGLIGSAVYMIMRRAPVRHIAYFGILTFYGMTHQGLRFSLLWVFLGLIFGMTHYVRQPLGTRSNPGLRGALPQVAPGPG